MIDPELQALVARFEDELERRIQVDPSLPAAQAADYRRRLAAHLLLLAEAGRPSADVLPLADLPKFRVEPDGEGRVVLSRTGYRAPQFSVPRAHKAHAYQRPLLLFLLAHHGRYSRVIDEIEAFLYEVEGDLGPLDYERTRTGVARAVTNTRSAANALRDFGFLKFTKREAYKVWELSFFGLLVAAELYADDWYRIAPGDEKEHGVDAAIYTAIDKLRRYDHFAKAMTVLLHVTDTAIEAYASDIEKSFFCFQDFARLFAEDQARTQKERKREAQAQARLAEDLALVERVLRGLGDRTADRVSAVKRRIAGLDRGNAPSVSAETSREDIEPDLFA